MAASYRRIVRNSARDVAPTHRRDGAAGSAGVGASLGIRPDPGFGGVCRFCAARARQTGRVAQYQDGQ